MLFRYINILLLFVVSWQYGPAQDRVVEDIKFENYTPRHGLPTDIIETITQDKYGFIWLGTHNGLVRFDGMDFKTYLHNNSDSNTLPDNDAKSIAVDSTGKIWVASRKGLFYYKFSDDNFTQVKTLAGGQSINWATSPVLGRQDQLWFYSNEGICHIDCKTLAASSAPTPDFTTFTYSVHRFFSTGSGNVWFFSDRALYFFDEASHIFQKQIILNNDGNIFREGIQAIFEENKEDLWIASFHGLYLLDRKDHRIQRYPYIIGNKTDGSMSVQGFHYCRPLTGDSILWCSTLYEGLVLFNLHTKRCVRSFMQDNYDASSLGGSFCYTSFVDRDGIVWVSHINGLSKMDWHDQQIKSYRIREMVDSNKMMPIRKMIPDKRSPANYWVAIWNYGVLYYNKSENRVIRHYQQPLSKSNTSDLFDDDAEYDDQGTLWVAAETGLFHYDAHSDKFIASKPRLPRRDGDTVIFRILKDKNNNLWLGTDAGLWKFNIPGKTFFKVHANNPADSSLVNSSVFALHFDHHGLLYVGTRIGLYVMDTLSGKITPMVREIGNNKTDFNINYIWGLDVDRHDNLWVATRGGGLYKFDPSGKTFTDYKTGNGLITEELRDIFIDSLENIWISSFDGIFKLDQRTRKFSRYTPEDGLDNFNISLGRWSIINNKIYSGSPAAYSIIDPYARMSLTNHFPIWISGIRVLNRAIHFNPDSSDRITVPVNYTENIINFEFSAISYTASFQIQYAYMLEGFDKDWHFCENQRFANYNNLAGGLYTFKVKAMNAGGIWGEKIASVNIYVTPAFWETWWFRALVAIILGLLITFLVKRRIANIRKEAGFKEQQALFRQKLAETEMIALRTQMNPHFIFNCMNIIDGLITDNRKKEAQEFLQKFSKLIRLVLENSQYQLVPLHQDIEALRLYVELEAIRYSHYFMYTFNIDPELLEDNYRIPPLLIQPYVENAIVHGLRHKESGQGRLGIHVRKEGNYVLITIEDNGIGRTRAKEFNQENRKPHQPIGMNVTGKRIDLLRMINLYKVGIDISDPEKGEDTGTRVTITLPLDSNSDKKY